MADNRSAHSGKRCRAQPADEILRHQRRTRHEDDVTQHVQPMAERSGLVELRVARAGALPIWSSASQLPVQAVALPDQRTTVVSNEYSRHSFAGTTRTHAQRIAAQGQATIAASKSGEARCSISPATA